MIPNLSDTLNVPELDKFDKIVSTFSLIKLSNILEFSEIIKFEETLKFVKNWKKQLKLRKRSRLKRLLHFRKFMELAKLLNFQNFQNRRSFKINKNWTFFYVIGRFVKNYKIIWENLKEIKPPEIGNARESPDTAFSKTGKENSKS